MVISWKKQASPSNPGDPWSQSGLIASPACRFFSSNFKRSYVTSWLAHVPQMCDTRSGFIKDGTGISMNFPLEMDSTLVWEKHPWIIHMEMFQVKPETIIPFRDVKTHGPHTILYPLEHGPMMIYTHLTYVETCSLDDSRLKFTYLTCWNCDFPWQTVQVQLVNWDPPKITTGRIQVLLTQEPVRVLNPEMGTLIGLQKRCCASLITK